MRRNPREGYVTECGTQEKFGSSHRFLNEMTTVNSKSTLSEPEVCLAMFIALVLSTEPAYLVGCTFSPHNADKRLKPHSRSQTALRYELRCFRSLTKFSALTEKWWFNYG